MELDSSLSSSLLHNLKLDDPLLHLKTWEAVSSESGTAASVDPILGSTEPKCDPSPISEASLVRLVINALQGVRSSLDDMEQLSAGFCLSPADRTSHRVSCLWHRSSSMNALGKLLKTMLRSGLVVFLLHKLVDYFLGTDHRSVKGQTRDKTTCEGCPVGSDPPYSLVNQAFAVAVGKVLEGYVCSLNTLFASVELRRSSKSVVRLEGNSFCLGSLTNIVHSEVTVLEVYLHTTQLRTHIEALGNICMLRVDDLAILTSSGMTAKSELLEFNYFPRGADLLSYLYVQLRDADPVHRSLLKFLFVRSCEPYCAFIKAWIFKARISDPYQEFIVDYTENPPASNDTTGYTDNLSPDFVKERPHASIPCFLKDISLPLLRAGQQLQVLMKLLVFCNHSITGGHNYGGAYVLCDLATVEDVLPFLSDSSYNSVYSLSKLTFCREDLEIMISKREAAYRMMWDRLQIFFTRLDVRSQQGTPFDFLPSLDRRTGANISFQSISDESFIFSPSTDDKESSNTSTDFEDSDISSTLDESSYETELLQPSKCSSLSISEEHNRTGESIEPGDIVIGPTDLFASSLLTLYAKENVLLKPYRSEPLRDPELSSPDKFETLDAMALTNQHHEDVNMSPICVPHQSQDSKCGILDDDYQSIGRWLLGGLWKNLFYADGKYRGQRELRFDDCGQKIIDKNTEKEGWKFEKMFVLDNSEMEQITGRTNLIKGCSRTSSNMCSPQSWNSQLNYNLQANPMLTKPAWLQTVFKQRDKNVMDYRGSSLSYFDFSFVENPLKVFLRRLPACSDYRDSYEDHTLVDSEYSPSGVNETGGDRVPIEHTNQSVLDPACSTSDSAENFLSEDHSESVSGGAKWERLLQNSGKEFIHTYGDLKHGSMAMSEMPLDVIVEKCVVQEVLLQYKYISSFTIKLLQEGFDLHEHLLALRRYHFMELADWADSFISLLWNQKWHINEPKQRVTEIQGLLNFALQKSSCESDPYKERLSIYTKEQTLVPLSTSAMGIQAFDYFCLGYRVDWPISIVMTQDALKIYAEIFSFLMQVRLAVFSLIDIWHLLKGLMHSTSYNRCVGGQDMNNFNAFMEIRQQVSHFVFTLQRYVHSQLSDVSWCRFLQSIKHQVKDMLDLDTVHMSYLADALHICFLSVEMRTVACIIKSILQCALDFRLCFPPGDCKVRSDGFDSSSLDGQVFAIKATFERNLKDLYACYLKSPKHGEFGLGLFWVYLNYNDYYSIAFGNATK